MKYLKIGIYELCALALIVFALALRLLLMALGWPPTNSDEATMGMMGMHIAYQGDHPALYYGQNYMGTIEAYLAAFFFHFFGTSLFALRLGLVLMVALFLVTIYLLARLLYSQRVALLTLLVLSMGSTSYLSRQIVAAGGSTQTMLFGALAFLLASWLVLTYRQDLSSLSSRQRWMRLIAYSGWGLAAGLGIWSDLLVVPFLLMSGLLLLLFCWREMRSPAPFLLLFFLILGASPFLYYNLSLVNSKGSSWNVLMQLMHENGGGVAPTTVAGYLHSIAQTILISIPTATGSPYCPVLELPWLGDTTAPSMACTLVHTAWGGGYLVLLGVALFISIRALLPLLATWRQRIWLSSWSLEEQRFCMQHTARLFLLLSAALTITIYALSSAPVTWLGFHARYLTGLLIAALAVIAPVVGLWERRSGQKRINKRALMGWILFLLIEGSLPLGTMITFSEAHAARATTQKQQLIVEYLLRIGVTHIYTDYWTCDRIAFQSKEQIVCDVVDDLMRSGFNRYTPYHNTVRGDPNSLYVFPSDISEARALALHPDLLPSAKHYQHLLYDDYVIYQPVAP